MHYVIERSEHFLFTTKPVSIPHREVVSAAGMLQPILMPKLYPALFDLYALHCDRDDEKYWERVQKLNKQGDMSLMAYLGIDQ